MTLRHGNMWVDSKADLKLFTGNASVRQDGCLVMGRGAALEAQKLYPGCNKIFGSKIPPYAKIGKRAYGLILLTPALPIGVFQVKWRFFDQAEQDLISYSAGMLIALASTEYKDRLISINFPGIGYGGLKRADVLWIVEMLPDNVEVWEK